MSLLGVLGVVFVVLKLVGVIAWSWWLVLMPFYIGLAFAVAVYGLVIAGFLIASLSGARVRISRRDRR